MALKISYGSGALGDVSEISTTVNSYAQVTALDLNSITIEPTTTLDGMATFSEGATILLHVSATSANKTPCLGKYLLATITNISGNVLTLDKDPTTCIPSDELANYHVQAIAVAQFKNLTLNAGNIVEPPVYSVTAYVGGIVAIMCSETLTFNGGHIKLSDCGIPPASKTLRPTSTYHDAAADTATYSGVENSATKDYFLLNSGDGACFLAAKKLVCHEDSRIGNVATYGCQFFRGASTSVTYDETKPSNVTNVGGSTIFIAAETIENFGHKMLAKYRPSSSTKGQGICRCYIASETKLRNDEGLYAYDCISKPSRIKDMNVKSFGNGTFGDVVNITTQLNNYATITAIDGVKVTYKTATTNGLAPITVGALVMIHFNHKSSANVEHSGRFILANVLGNTGTVLTLDTAPPNISVEDYAAQIVSIPQANNFTLAKENSATPAFNGTQGGICAIAVKNNCDLSSGKLNVKSKGGGNAYAREGLGVIGNAQDCDKLPIGQGHGSIFLLAQNLTLNAASRLGHTDNASGNFSYKDGDNGGSGANCHSGCGYGSNATLTNAIKQGAHLLIIADKVTGLALNSICTGGGTAAAGKGSYGGYNGGGYYRTSGGTRYYGGSSGWAFIYCNNAVDQDTTNIIYDN